MESVGGEVKTVIISKHEGFRWKNDKNSLWYKRYEILCKIVFHALLQR